MRFLKDSTGIIYSSNIHRGEEIIRDVQTNQRYFGGSDSSEFEEINVYFVDGKCIEMEETEKAAMFANYTSVQNMFEEISSDYTNKKECAIATIVAAMTFNTIVKDYFLAKK